MTRARGFLSLPVKKQAEKMSQKFSPCEEKWGVGSLNLRFNYINLFWVSTACVSAHGRKIGRYRHRAIKRFSWIASHREDVSRMFKRRGGAKSCASSCRHSRLPPFPEVPAIAGGYWPGKMAAWYQGTNPEPPDLSIWPHKPGKSRSNTGPTPGLCPRVQAPPMPGPPAARPSSRLRTGWG